MDVYRLGNSFCGNSKRSYCVYGLFYEERYYPLPEIYPWITAIFVAEAYRGYRISEKLIYFANGYAEKCGVLRTYIPSKHIGLYEKYGYRYLKHIANYDNETERLYVKELNNIAF